MRRLPTRLALASVATAAVIGIAVTPQLLGSQVGAAFERLDAAEQEWLWTAGVLVIVTLAAWAQAWRAVIRSCGGDVGRLDACARYAIGSAVNTLAPARLGDVVRIALFSRTLDNPERTWTSSGAYTTVGSARTLVVAALVLAGYLAGALPLWPMLALALVAGAGVTVALAARRRNPHSRAAHFFDAYRQLGRRPRDASRLLAWMIVSTAARVGAVAAIVSSLGIHRPLGVAMLIIPAIDAASLLPLTPANIGVSSGAVVVALHGYGIGSEEALTISVGLHAVEAVVGVLCGAVGLVLVAARPAPRPLSAESRVT